MPPTSGLETANASVVGAPSRKSPNALPVKGRLKSEGAKVIRSKRRRKALQVEVPHPPHIDPALQRMFAKRKRHIVAELHRLRLRDARLVPPNRRKARPRAEVERRKRMRRRMLADVHARADPTAAKPLAPSIAKPTLVVTFVKPNRNSFSSLGVIAYVCDTSRLRLWMLSTSFGRNAFAKFDVMFFRLNRAYADCFARDRLVDAHIGPIRPRRSRRKILIVIVRLPANIRQRIVVSAAPSPSG